MKRIVQFANEMERSEKSDERIRSNFANFSYYFYEATRRNGTHLILQGVVEQKYTTSKLVVMG